MQSRVLYKFIRSDFPSQSFGERRRLWRGWLVESRLLLPVRVSQSTRGSVCEARIEWRAEREHNYSAIVWTGDDMMELSKHTEYMCFVVIVTRLDVRAGPLSWRAACVAHFVFVRRARSPRDENVKGAFYWLDAHCAVWLRGESNARRERSFLINPTARSLAGIRRFFTLNERPLTRIYIRTSAVTARLLLIRLCAHSKTQRATSQEMDRQLFVCDCAASCDLRTRSMWLARMGIQTLKIHTAVTSDFQSNNICCSSIKIDLNLNFVFIFSCQLQRKIILEWN